ncbi:MAG: acyl-CoA thioesterase [Saprospiraceae bacterium]|nr:acyl-CoA thioesterase [Saprospiraceae bacterium]
MKQNNITFQFISEPSDVNYGGKVHGGVVMKWIDQAAFACASAWAGTYCVTVYVGGIRFYRPIHIGDLVRVHARIIYTGTTSMHIAIDLESRPVTEGEFQKTTHCIIVFAAVDGAGKTQPVPKWIPVTEQDRQLERYAIKLMDLRKQIEAEMKPFQDLP